MLQGARSMVDAKFSVEARRGGNKRVVGCDILGMRLGVMSLRERCAPRTECQQDWVRNQTQCHDPGRQAAGLGKRKDSSSPISAAAAA